MSESFIFLLAHQSSSTSDLMTTTTEQQRIETQNIFKSTMTICSKRAVLSNLYGQTFGITRLSLAVQYLWQFKPVNVWTDLAQEFAVQKVVFQFKPPCLRVYIGIIRLVVSCCARGVAADLLSLPVKHSPRSLNPLWLAL